MSTSVLYRLSHSAQLHMMHICDNQQKDIEFEEMRIKQELELEKLRKENEELRISNKRKRKYREETYTQALNGDLLPVGLSKIGENAYQCEKEDCEDCQNLKSPFSHFKGFTRKSRCQCHMCELYNSSGKLEIFQELAELDDRRTEYKKKRQ